MSEILRFLLSYGLGLFRPGGFQFIESQVSSSFGGDAYVLLASDDLRLKFTWDRGQLLLSFQSTRRQRESQWFSVELVRELVTGETQDSGVLDSGYGVFLRDHLSTVEAAFSNGNLERTLERLRQLRAARSRRLFG